MLFCVVETFSTPLYQFNPGLIWSLLCRSLLMKALRYTLFGIVALATVLVVMWRFLSPINIPIPSTLDQSDMTGCCSYDKDHDPNNTRFSYTRFILGRPTSATTGFYILERATGESRDGQFAGCAKWTFGYNWPGTMDQLGDRCYPGLWPNPSKA